MIKRNISSFSCILENNGPFGSGILEGWGGEMR
jgi:hypothetical protein